MEEEKREQKRKKSKKKKSKSLPVEALGLACNSKDIRSSDLNEKVHTCKKAKIMDIHIVSHKEPVCQNEKDFEVKLKTNRSGKKRKRIKTEKLAVKSPNFKDNSRPCDKKHSTATGINQSVLNESAKEKKLKKGSVAFGQTLSSNRSNISTQKLRLKAKLQNKLESGRFRWINEKLYTADSLCAFQMFKAEPELFDVYHQGFSSQVQKWPVNPVDTMINWIMERSPKLIIADMGCGEAKISQCVPNKVFSFDLVAMNNFVTACDMAKVPLADESIDIVIYCLSLMGTNLNEFLQEAKRILKSNGILKIAEVVSRFECLRSFEETVCSFGFKLLAKDTTNKMFVQFEFKKLFKKPDQTTTLPLTLKPCLYKRR